MTFSLRPSDSKLTIKSSCESKKPENEFFPRWLNPCAVVPSQKVRKTAWIEASFLAFSVAALFLAQAILGSSSGSYFDRSKGSFDFIF